MEMKNDSPGTYSQELQLPKPISGLNIWPPQNPNVTTRDIYNPIAPISYAEINDELYINPEPPRRAAFEKPAWEYMCSSNRGERRGNFAVNPEWTSENKTFPPKTARTIGKVYEPNAVDFHGARDLHARTWEQARIYPGHGTNTHLAEPGYTPYKHAPVHYRDFKQDIADSWPYNQFIDMPDSTQLEPAQVYKRPRTASGAYYTHIPEDNSRYTQELNALHAVHVHDKMNSGKPDIETREFTRSNREITYGYNRPITDKNPYADLVTLPQPISVGGHRDVTDLFAQTYSRNLPQMLFRKAQHAHAPWHAYMTFCDWGEPPREPKAVA